MTDKTKQCSKCREVKSVCAFTKDASRKDRLDKYCKACKKRIEQSALRHNRLEHLEKTKSCIYCHEEKKVAEFESAPRGKFGVNAICNVCRSALQRRYRKTEAGKRVIQKHDQKEKTKENKRIYARRYARRYPEKIKATTKVANALRRGAVKRQPCGVCGDLPAEAHHDDYSRPLDVRWLCKKHHVELHWLEGSYAKN